MSRRSVVVRQTSTNLKQVAFLIRQVLFVLIPIILIAMLPRQPYLQVQKIDCQIDTQECSDQTKKMIEPFLNQFIFSVQPRLVDQKLITDPYFESVNTQIQFPNTLRVRISSQKNLLNVGFIKLQSPIETSITVATSSATPSASPHPILKDLPKLAQTPSKFYSLTKNGTLLDSTKTETFAYILSDNFPDASNLVSFYKLFFELFQSGQNIDKIWYTNRWVGAKLKTGPLVVFGNDSDALKSVTTLQQILAQATMDLTQAVIDLRFNKPVITNNP